MQRKRALGNEGEDDDDDEDALNLATGTLIVRASKTEAGQDREVDMPIGLVEELTEWKLRSPATGPTDPVFTSEPRNGRAARQTKRNVQARLKTTSKTANKRLAELGIAPISERVTPHSFRRTFASLRFAAGDDPVYVSEQMGHEKPTFSMQVYASAVRRRERLSGAYLAEFDRAIEWASQRAPVTDKGTGTGTESRSVASVPANRPQLESAETAPLSRKSHHAGG
jgi:integrase